MNLNKTVYPAPEYNKPIWLEECKNLILVDSLKEKKKKSKIISY